MARSWGQRNVAGSLAAGATGSDLTLSGALRADTLRLDGSIAQTLVIPSATATAELGGAAVIGTGITLQAGQLLLPDGTLAAPAIARALATNTGIAFPAGVLNLIVGAIARATFTSVNNLGPTVLNARAGRTPTAQTLATVGTTILTTTSIMLLTGGAASPGIMTAVPNITAGSNGDELILVNVAANTITLQDETALAGSKVRTKGGAAALALPQYEARSFIYETTTAAWHEQ